MVRKLKKESIRLCGSEVTPFITCYSPINTPPYKVEIPGFSLYTMPIDIPILLKQYINPKSRTAVRSLNFRTNIIREGLRFRNELYLDVFIDDNPGWNTDAVSRIFLICENEDSTGSVIETIDTTIPKTLLKGGSPDPNFKPNIQYGRVTAIAAQSDDKIIVGGSFGSINNIVRNRIARLNSDGTLDNYYDPDSDQMIKCLFVTHDNKCYVGGAFSRIGGTSGLYRAARLNSTGEDDGFYPQIYDVPDTVVNAILPLSDGSIVLCGKFTSVSLPPPWGDNIYNMIKCDDTGTVDITFLPNVNNEIFCVAKQEDGKIIIGGDFTVVSGFPRKCIARLNSDGSLDTSFDPGASDRIYTIAIQSDGKILIGGRATRISEKYIRLARFNIDGTFDDTFCLINFDGEGPKACAVQPDGKILVGGTFSEININSRGWQKVGNLVRLNTDGSLDNTFSLTIESSSPDVEITSIKVVDNSTFFIGGYFDKVNDIEVKNLAKIVELYDEYLDNDNTPVASISTNIVEGNSKNYVTRRLTAVAMNWANK